MPAILSVIVIVVVVLRSFREITAEMLSPQQAKRFRTYSRLPYLLLLTLLIVWPLFGTIASEAGLIGTTTVRLMSVFQAYGALLVLLAPLAVMQEFDAQFAKSPTDERFDLPQGILLLATAAFAGYLTMWSREPMSVVIVIFTGWFLFRHFVLGTYDFDDATPTPADLAKRFTGFLSEFHLLGARRSALEKKFTEGKYSLSSLAIERERLDIAGQALQDELGMTPSEARRRLFRHGPSSSPLKNGVRGALAGLIVAALLQLLFPFDLAAITAASESGWLALLDKIVVDPQYLIVAEGVKESHLLVFLNEVLNAISLWVVAGFLFGYMFHVVRGRDGFVKAAVFGTGIVIPYLLSQVMVAGGENISITALIRVVPLLIFLLGLGVIVFDGSVLRHQGIGLSKLPVIYGLRNTIGYLSLASGLAAIQPLLALADWLAGSG
jgi:hypothetical protein